MRDHSTKSGKAGNESSLQTDPPQQDKEMAAGTRQGQTNESSAPIGFDVGKMPVFHCLLAKWEQWLKEQKT